jgi:hypothetical protein
MIPVYIIIVNYKRWQDTQECLESIFRSSYKDFSVIVIDNDSQNESLKHLMRWAENSTRHYIFSRKEDITGSTIPASFPQLTLIQNNINAGFAGGINLALRFLQNQDAYVWLLNPDMVVEENTLDELVRFTVLQSSDCIVGAEIRSFQGNRKLLFYGGGKINFFSATIREADKPGDISQLDYISGGCLFTHAANFKKYGLLPEEYFLYWEETDWCYRAKKNGCRLIVCPMAICYDKISTVIGKSFMADYYYTRNGLLFIIKYGNKNRPVVLFFVGLRFLKRVVTGRWGRARGVFKGAMDFLKLRHDECK